MDPFEAVETRADNHVGGWLKTMDGIRLWVEIRGMGRPLVLLHGWTMSSLFWRRQARLAETCQVITVDFRGHGRSQATPRGHTLPRYAMDVHEVLCGLGLVNATLMGWSMGGSVVLEYWRQYGPGRLAGIGLVETGPYPMSAAPWNLHKCHGFNQEAMEENLAAMAEDRQTYARNFVNAMFLSGRGPEHAVRWMQEEQKKPPTSIARDIYRDYAQRDYTPVLPTVDLPALIIYGRSKNLARGLSTGRFVAGTMPEAGFTVLDKSGHMPFYEQPEEFNAAVTRFLTNLPG